MSKGKVELSLTRLGVSVSSVDVGRMYPAVARRLWRQEAQPSRMKLCAIFLLFLTQQKAWSP